MISPHLRPYIHPTLLSSSLPALLGRTDNLAATTRTRNSAHALDTIYQSYFDAPSTIVALQTGMQKTRQRLYVFAIQGG